MAMNIKGINTGVIRKANEFIALALKVKDPRNKESLFFFSALELRDLLIALESRLHQKQQLKADERQQYEKARDKVSKKMLDSTPSIQEEELRNADINRRVNTVALTRSQEENLLFTLTLHNGKTCELAISELQIEATAHAIIRAIDNAGMRELALRITSLLDFLPLYDADCLNNGNLEYDSYTQSEWKHQLFPHYLAILYRFANAGGQEHISGVVVKSRSLSDSKEVEAISRRLLDFSPRLQKWAGKPCQVFVRTLTADSTQQLSQEQCLRALHHLHVQSARKAQNT